MSKPHHSGKPIIRYKYLIAPKFQLGIAVYVLILALLERTYLYYTLKGFLQAEAGEAQQISAEPRWAEDAWRAAFDRFDGIFAVHTVVLTAVILIGVIFITHRAAGPIYRLNTFLADWIAGKRGKLSFRKHDYFQETADKMNRVLHPPQDGDSE